MAHPANRILKELAAVGIDVATARVLHADGSIEGTDTSAFLFTLVRGAHIPRIADYITTNLNTYQPAQPLKTALGATSDEWRAYVQIQHDYVDNEREKEYRALITPKRLLKALLGEITTQQILQARNAIDARIPYSTPLP